MKNWFFKENSLDLIRLFAAAQVCVLHTFEFMFSDKTGSLFFQFLRLFPGVPIFFFLSGFLISKSYESSPGISKYTRNRVLRIFPALVVVVLVNIVLVLSTGYLKTTNASIFDVVLLFLAKSTFVQFYNPPFMRGFGDGVLNGSLWTICVELQFYIITPILYMIVLAKNVKNNNLILLLLIAGLILVNRTLYSLAPQNSHEIWWKLFRVSFIPWFYMFLTGVFVQRNFSVVSKYISRVDVKYHFIFYCALAYMAQRNGFELGNAISPFIFFPLISLMLNLAYYKPESIGNVTKGNDISYGVYIWHMPIVNQFLFYDLRHYVWHAILAIVIAVVMAILSWIVIEKPFLKMKKYTIKQDAKILPQTTTP